MKLFLEVIALCCVVKFISSQPNFNYERMHNYGLGKRVIQNYRTINLKPNEYPEPMPSTKISDLALIRQPFRRLQQGVRRPNMDVRVFRKSFNYPPSAIGQRITCESLLDCTITYISVETEEAIPIIFRGGVGYQHFTIIVRSHPGHALKGTITVFCNKTLRDDLG